MWHYQQHPNDLLRALTLTTLVAWPLVAAAEPGEEYKRWMNVLDSARSGTAERRFEAYKELTKLPATYHLIYEQDSEFKAAREREDYLRANSHKIGRKSLEREFALLRVYEPDEAFANALQEALTVGIKDADPRLATLAAEAACRLGGSAKGVSGAALSCGTYVPRFRPKHVPLSDILRAAADANPKPLLEVADRTDVAYSHHALWALTAAQNSQVLPILIRYLQHSDLDLITVGLYGAREVKDSTIVAHLAKLLDREGDDAKLIRFLTWSALHNQGSAAAPIARARFHSSKPDERGWATSVLSQARDPQSLELLLLATKDAKASIRSTAVAGFAYYKGRRAQGESPAIKPAPEEFWPTIEDAIRSLLSDPDPFVRVTVIETLGQNPPAFSLPLVRMLLKDPESEVRVDALFAGEALGDPQIVDHARALFRDLESSKNAALLLGRLGDRAFLFRALSEGSDKEREAAVYGVAQMHDQEADSKLLEALKDKHERVRLQAIDCLSERERLSDHVVPLLNDPSSAVRDSAAWFLRNNPTEHLVQQVQLLLAKGDNPDVALIKKVLLEMIRKLE